MRTRLAILAILALVPFLAGAATPGCTEAGATGATVTSNRLVNGQTGGGIRVMGARHTVQGNTILMTGAGSQGIILDSTDMALITGNRIESTGGAYVLGFSGSAPQNMVITGNIFKRNGDLWNLTLTGATGMISGNVYDGAPRWNGSGVGVLR